MAQVPGLAPDAGAAVRAAERLARPSPGALPPAADVRFTSQTPPANAEEIRFTLERLTVEGATVYDEDALAELWAGRLGREISLADLFALAGEVQRRYRLDGYLFTRVLVPAQRIEGGEARLEVVEAVIGRVAIEEPGVPIGPVRALAERIAAPLEGLRNPHVRDVERVLLLLNDVPGITRAAAVPKVGEGERGAVDLFINMEREAFDATVFADNRQSPLIGDGLVGAVVSFNSWSPQGDSSSLSVFNSVGFDDWGSESFHERHTIQLDHVTFLGAAGTRLAGRALWSQSAPGDVVRDFEITGDQVELELLLTHPLLRGRAFTLEVYGGLSAVEVGSVTPAAPVGAPGGGGRPTQDLVVDDHLRVARLGAEIVQRDAYGYTEATLESRFGLPFFGASRAGDGELSRQDGSGEFWSLRGSIERTLILEKGVSLWGKAWGQWADRPLLATEEFSIGGPELGRAFHPSEYAGDIGAGVAAEVRLNETFTWETLRVPYELYGFADLAEVRNLEGGQPVHRALVSAGGGVRAQFFGHTAVNLEAARPMNRPLSYNGSDAWRFLFSATRQF